MKRILILMAVMAFGLLQAQAQKQEFLRWGVTAGFNAAKLSPSVFDAKLGWHAGVRAELLLPKLADGLFIDAAALLTGKGAKVDGGDLVDMKVNAYYLELPVRMGYRYEVDRNFNLYGSFGPYAAIGLFGKTKGTTLDYEDDELGKVTDKYDTFGDDGFDRLDLGLGLRFGVEFFRKYQLSLSYDFGLIEAYESGYLEEGEESDGDIHWDSDIDLGDGAKTRNLSVSLTYIF